MYHYSVLIVEDFRMTAQRILAILLFLFVAWGAVAQGHPDGADGSGAVFISTDEAMKLYLKQMKAEPETGDTGGYVTSIMRRTDLKTAWVTAQILVDERGQVLGVQSLDGTPEVLSAAVREIRRYKFKPYNTERGAMPFVTVLNLKYGIREPECSLTNPKPCR